MILIELRNAVVYNMILQRLEAYKPGEKPESLDMTCTDFDRVFFYITNTSDRKKIKVSIQFANANMWGDLQKCGVEQYLKNVYGALLVEPEPSYNATVQIDLESVTESQRAEMADKVALLKRHCYAAAFDKFFAAQQKGETAKPVLIRYREDEWFLLSAFPDRVSVVIRTRFTNEEDGIYARVLLQEMKEMRRKVSEAPQVLYSPPSQRPSEVDAMLESDTSLRAAIPPKESEKDTDRIGYITFVLFPRHTAPAAAANSINMLHTFRDYLHYHIKCSKAYMHLRMSAKSADFLKVLERAKPTSTKPVEKKTFSGRTFRQNE